MRGDKSIRAWTRGSFYSQYTLVALNYNYDFSVKPILALDVSALILEFHKFLQKTMINP